MINTKKPTPYLWTSLASTLLTFYSIILNYTSGIYPTHQDSIAIPLIASTGALAALLLLVAIQNPLYKQLKNNRPTTIISISLSLTSTALSSALLIKTINDWLSPNHFSASALYFATLLIYIIYQYALYKNLFTRKNTPRTRFF